MTREQLLEKSLESLREIAKAQGVKSITKYRKAELVEIIMNYERRHCRQKPADFRCLQSTQSNA